MEVGSKDHRSITSSVLVHTGKVSTFDCPKSLRTV